ncbi:hypothetical protein AKJ16_DCAP22205 [Drosera capensis]
MAASASAAEESTSVPLSPADGDPEDPAKVPLTSSSNSSTRQFGNQFVWERWGFDEMNTVVVVEDYEEFRVGMLSALVVLFDVYYGHCDVVSRNFMLFYLNSGPRMEDHHMIDSYAIMSWLGLVAGIPQTCSSPPSPFIACCYVLQSWVSRKFMTGCVVLFPVAVTFFITFWIIQFVDGFFSPIYKQLGIDIFGLGFVTSLLFVFLVGIFVSSWLGGTVFWLGEWFIKKMPFVRHIYSASKQISTAISPDQNTTAFKEVGIIRHPRVGEYAFGFITSSVVLQMDEGDEELCSVFVPTNHLYIGDIFLINSKDIIREGIEIIVSGGMTMPQTIAPMERLARPRFSSVLPRLFCALRIQPLVGLSSTVVRIHQNSETFRENVVLILTGGHICNKSSICLSPCETREYQKIPSALSKQGLGNSSLELVSLVARSVPVGLAAMHR